MKHHAILFAFLGMLISVPAFAVDARHCESQANRLQGAEKGKFLKQCLAQLSTPSNVKVVSQQLKKATCEQNAKNKGLTSSGKGDYINDCLSKNEAATAKEAVVAKEEAAKIAEKGPTLTTLERKSNKTQQKSAQSTSSKKKHKKNKSAS